MQGVLLQGAQCQHYPFLASDFAQLEDEPPLQFSRLYALDGNSSLKRAAMFEGRTQADARVLDDSSYWLSREYINKFASEVRGVTKNTAVRHRNGDESSEDENDWEDVEDVGNEPGDPTDGLCEHVACAKHPAPTSSAPAGPAVADAIPTLADAPPLPSAPAEQDPPLAAPDITETASKDPNPK